MATCYAKRYASVFIYDNPNFSEQNTKFYVNKLYNEFTQMERNG